jgi:hypothetical protein
MAQKFTNRFNNGDYIRGYDFQPMRGRGDSFIEGTVIDANNTERGYLAFKIKVENRVFGGKQEAPEADEIGWIPHEVHFLEYDHRVIGV